MTKPQNMKPAGEGLNEAGEGLEVSTSDLSLLTSDLVALRKAHQKPLNETELQAVYGMIAYVAYSQSVREDVVCEVMIAHFGINAVAALPSRLYQEAIEYLVDLKMDKVIN